ncbi:hypothetical protein [Desulfogranum mediterraneum]|uniref:hypothetical protein n=1 Tax=Desulfogranum mediterraneum TaxID=160661 RepID=UPI0004219FDC|nr:hypothetical protein [Desulfogranum mediterraneum]
MLIKNKKRYRKYGLGIPAILCFLLLFSVQSHASGMCMNTDVVEDGDSLGEKSVYDLKRKYRKKYFSSESEEKAFDDSPLNYRDKVEYSPYSPANSEAGKARFEWFNKTHPKTADALTDKSSIIPVSSDEDFVEKIGKNLLSDTEGILLERGEALTSDLLGTLGGPADVVMWGQFMLSTFNDENATSYDKAAAILSFSPIGVVMQLWGPAIDQLITRARASSIRHSSHPFDTTKRTMADYDTDRKRWYGFFRNYRDRYLLQAARQVIDETVLQYDNAYKISVSNIENALNVQFEHYDHELYKAIQISWLQYLDKQDNDEGDGPDNGENLIHTFMMDSGWKYCLDQTLPLGDNFVNLAIPMAKCLTEDIYYEAYPSFIDFVTSSADYHSTVREYIIQRQWATRNAITSIDDIKKTLKNDISRQVREEWEAITRSSFAIKANETLEKHFTASAMHEFVDAELDRMATDEEIREGRFLYSAAWTEDLCGGQVTGGRLFTKRCSKKRNHPAVYKTLQDDSHPEVRAQYNEIRSGLNQEEQAQIIEMELDRYLPKLLSGDALVFTKDNFMHLPSRQQVWQQVDRCLANSPLLQWFLSMLYPGSTPEQAANLVLDNPNLLAQVAAFCPTEPANSKENKFFLYKPGEINKANAAALFYASIYSFYPNVYNASRKMDEMYEKLTSLFDQYKDDRRMWTSVWLGHNKVSAYEVLNRNDLNALMRFKLFLDDKDKTSCNGAINNNGYIIESFQGALDLRTYYKYLEYIVYPYFSSTALLTHADQVMNNPVYSYWKDTYSALVDEAVNAKDNSIYFDNIDIGQFYSAVSGLYADYIESNLPNDAKENDYQKLDNFYPFNNLYHLRSTINSSSSVQKMEDMDGAFFQHTLSPKFMKWVENRDVDDIISKLSSINGYKHENYMKGLSIGDNFGLNNICDFKNIEDAVYTMLKHEDAFGSRYFKLVPFLEDSFRDLLGVNLMALGVADMVQDKVCAEEGGYQEQLWQDHQLEADDVFSFTSDNQRHFYSLTPTGFENKEHLTWPDWDESDGFFEQVGSIRLTGNSVYDVFTIDNNHEIKELENNSQRLLEYFSWSRKVIINTYDGHWTQNIVLPAHVPENTELELNVKSTYPVNIHLGDSIYPVINNQTAKFYYSYGSWTVDLEDYLVISDNEQIRKLENNPEQLLRYFDIVETVYIKLQNGHWTRTLILPDNAPDGSELILDCYADWHTMVFNGDLEYRTLKNMRDKFRKINGRWIATGSVILQPSE